MCDAPGDALPTQLDALVSLARSLGTTPTDLREDYRRVTRRTRRVVERVFYGQGAERASTGPEDPVDVSPSTAPKRRRHAGWPWSLPIIGGGTREAYEARVVKT